MQTRILRNWQPSELNEETIRKEFSALFECYEGSEFSFRRKDHFQLRTPQQCRQVRASKSAATRWHRDDQSEPGLYIMWSNIKPTEVMTRGKRKLEIQDGDIILLDNLEVVHRAPSTLTDEDNRWFIRVLWVEDWWPTLHLGEYTKSYIDYVV